MNTIQIETPVVVNGIVLTDNIIEALDFLYFGGATHIPFSEKNYYDNILAEKLNDCTDVILFLISQKIGYNNPELTKEELLLIQKMYFLHDFIKWFKLPDEVIETINKKVA